MSSGSGNGMLGGAAADKNSADVLSRGAAMNIDTVSDVSDMDGGHINKLYYGSVASASIGV